MAFNPNVPQPSDLLSKSQQDLLTNNTNLNAIYSIDHLPLTNATATKGYHKIVHLLTPNPNVNPSAVAAVGQLYSRQITQYGNTDEVLFYLSGGNRLSQLTSILPSTVSNANGAGSTTRYSSLPGGYMLISGFTTNSTDGSTLNLSTTALATIISIQLMPLGNSSSGTNRALVAQPRSVNTAAGTMVINLQDVNNNSQASSRTVYFEVIGI